MNRSKTKQVNKHYTKQQKLRLTHLLKLLQKELQTLEIKTNLEDNQLKYNNTTVAQLTKPEQSNYFSPASLEKCIKGLAINISKRLKASYDYS